MPTATIDRRREEFPTLQDGIYLLSHSLGPAPRGADEAMLEYTRMWREHTAADAWDAAWWELSGEVGDRFARLIGAGPGTVQVQPNASLAMSAVASCFDFSQGAKRKVVTTALDFPSMGYIWEGQRELGAEVCVVPSESDISMSTERILDAIDDETCLVAVSYVSYRSSNRIDADAIVKRAHQVGAKVVLDAYQAAGVCEIDADGWRVDFLIGGTIKWLCGGPACGFLYVRPDLHAVLEPRLTGWFAHARPLDFQHGKMQYDASIRRFANGTPSVPALYSCLPGLKIIERVGVESIAAESRRRTQHVVDFALQRGWTLHCPADVNQRGGTVMIDVANPTAFVSRLAARGVFVDCRPGVGIRLSPHFFNTDDEIEQTLSILTELMN